MRIIVFQGKDKKWYFHFRANNNKIVAASEGYNRKHDCIRTVEHMKDYMQDDIPVRVLP